jgi:hypothetical protein
MTDAPAEPISLDRATATPPRPTSGAIVRYDGPRSTAELQTYALLLATNGDGNARQNQALPAVFRENPAALAYVVEYARALDIPPVTAIVGVHFIDGKMTASAGLISALIRRAGHRLVGPVISGTYEAGDLRAVTRITRKDDPETTYESVWTLQRAERADLVKLGPDGKYHAVKPRSAWDTYPENMLKARSLTECGRDGAEDALMGMHYTPEELGAEVDGNGEIVYNVTQVQNWGTGDKPAGEQPAEKPKVSEAYLDELRAAILDASTTDDLKVIWGQVEGSGLFTNETWASTPIGDRNSEMTTCKAFFNAEVARLKARENPDDGQAAETPPSPDSGPQGDNLGLPYELVYLPNGQVDQVATLRNEVAWKKARQAAAGVPEPTGERPAAAPRKVQASAHEQVLGVMADELTPQEVRALGVHAKECGLTLTHEDTAANERDAAKLLDAVDRLLAWRPYDPANYGNPAADKRIDHEGNMYVPAHMPTGEQAAAMGLDAVPVEEIRHDVNQEHAATIAEQHADTVEDRSERDRQFNPAPLGKDAAIAAAREANRAATVKTQPPSNPAPN